MESQFGIVVLVEYHEKIGAHKSIKKMHRAYESKSRAEDAMKLARDICPGVEFDLVPVELVD